MPAKSPLPKPQREEDAFSRSRTETPSSFASTAFMRKSLVTPSPAGTAETEKMTPLPPSPMPEIESVASSPADSITASIQRARSYVGLNDDVRGEDPMNMQTPDGEWRIRTLFLEESNGAGTIEKPPQIHKRARSFQDPSDYESPALPPRSSLKAHAESDSSVPKKRRSNRRRSSRSASQMSRSQNNTFDEDWPGALGTAERRRSSSTSLVSSVMSSTLAAHKKSQMETPTTSSSSDLSPDASPNRLSNSSGSNRVARKQKVSTSTAEADGATIKAVLTYRLGRMRTNRLVLVLCLVAGLSLGLTVLTNRAVNSIKVEDVIDNEELEEAMNRYERMHESPIRRSKHPPASGLRGSLVQKVGRHRVRLPPTGRHEDSPETAAATAATKKDTKPETKTTHTSERKRDKKKPVVKPPTKVPDKPPAEKVQPKAEEPAVAAKDATDVHKKQLEIVSPTKKLGKVKRSFNDVDVKMFVEQDVKPRNGEFPRVLCIHESISQKTPTSHHVQLYPADFTDNTQLYGVLDSADERLKRMEIRDPYSDEHCVPMQEWQTTYHPSCNGMHEMALNDMVEDSENEAHLFGTKGYWRNAWKVDVLAGRHRPEDRETVVLKTLKFEHKFEDAHFEHDRIDAVAMERLTSSPHVINVFGFCGHSVVTEYAEGTRVGELADKSRKIPLARLKIARDIANGLADVHGIDGDGNATFVHLDINPANVVSIGGTLKLNDFNIGIILRWNQTSNQHCGFPAQYPNPQWRSPEEARNEQNLTEKVDVFSMGHIFFRLICGHEPWNKLEVGGKPTKEEINAKVQKGVLPHIPQEIMESTDKEVSAIRDAMLRCYTFDPSKRPSARFIANALQSALDKLSPSQHEKYA